MAKCILCLGDKSNLALEKLDYNVGGIDLIGCPYTSGLEKCIKQSGKISKILIFENSIDGDIPECIKNNDYDTIFILNKLDLMQKYDIDYFSYDNIQIIDNKNAKITFPYIRELISASTIEPYRLYKSEDIEVENTQIKDELIPEDTNLDNLNEGDTSSYKIEEEDDVPTLTDEGKESFTEVDFDETPKREVSLEKEEEIIPTLATGRSIDPDEDIKNIIKYYKGGCIVVFTGCPKAYTSTTVLRVARYLAKIGLTVGLIDLDFKNYTLGTVDKAVYDTVQISDTNNLQKALRENNMISNSFLIENNLHLLTSPINRESLDHVKSLELLDKLIEKHKKFYNILLLDMQLSDINILHDIVMKTNKIVFNIPSESKDYITFMRTVETLEDDVSLREKVFKESVYLSVNDNKDKKLNSKHSDIKAIDDLLASFGNINELKYEDIPNVGSIMKNKDIKGYMGPKPKDNEKETKNMILKIFGGKP